MTENAEIFLRENDPIMHLIDTQGTNDTNNLNNNEVLLSLFAKFLIDEEF